VVCCLLAKDKRSVGLFVAVGHAQDGHNHTASTFDLANKQKMCRGEINVLIDTEQTGHNHITVVVIVVIGGKKTL
jgi:hypothetical protein